MQFNNEKEWRDKNFVNYIDITILLLLLGPQIYLCIRTFIQIV